MKLAARLGIPLVTVTHSDSGDLASIFTTWLPKSKGRPVARKRVLKRRSSRVTDIGEALGNLAVRETETRCSRCETT